jgi:hypothetical protein
MARGHARRSTLVLAVVAFSKHQRQSGTTVQCEMSSVSLVTLGMRPIAPATQRYQAKSLLMLRFLDA